ncbi:MAG: hypothetical protein ACE361_22325 [Aureliella sp.]
MRLSHSSCRRGTFLRRLQCSKATLDALVMLTITVCFPSHLLGQAEQPKLPDPPKEIAELIDQGKVKIEFYDRMPAGQRFEGETHFQFDVNYRFRFRFPRQDVRTGRRYVDVTLHSIRVLPQNRISVPRAYADENVWQAGLILHEFEHVRINSDPRLYLLLRKLVSGVKRIELPANTVDRNTIGNTVDRQVQTLITATTELLQKNNDLLDTVTRHGITPEYKDINFFHRLFMEDNLREQGFAYLPQVKTLLKSRSYSKHAKSDQTLQPED